MKPSTFGLAATTNDLTQEEHVRDVADVIEFRMDKAEDPLTQLSTYDGELSIIATNRAQWFGGQAHDTGRLDQLFAASEFDVVEMVDIEMETARGTDWVLQEFRDNDVEIIISVHVFDDTPDLDTLNAIFAECARYGDVAKVATFAHEYADSLRMLEAVHTATTEGLRVAGISMGEVGSHTRVIAPLYGSSLGYAPLEADEMEYAPGQIHIHKLASMIETLNATDEGLTEAPSEGNSVALAQGVAKTE